MNIENSAKKTTLFYKTSLVLFGCFLGFLLLEIVFRVFPLFWSLQEKGLDEGAFKVLCVGDSSTFGLGLSNRDQDSYPAQLERIWNQEGKARVKVYNAGLPGINSSMGVQIFNEKIRIIEPDLILVCVGMNDAWNWEGSNIYNYYPGEGVQKIWISLRQFFSQFKVIRFLKLSILSYQIDQDPEWHHPGFKNQAIDNNFNFLPDEKLRQEALKKSLAENISLMRDAASRQGMDLFFLEYHAAGWGNSHKVLHERYDSMGVASIESYFLFNLLDYCRIPIRGEDGWHLNKLGYELWVKMILHNLEGKITHPVPAINLNKEIHELLKPILATDADAKSVFLRLGFREDLSAD